MLNYHSWYTVEDQQYYNKNQAFIAAGGDLSKIKLHFMEDYWDSVDWQSEPTETWQELYALRAQELRDKYNYVALWYTGGYDSHTILQTFIKNNITLDEIVIYDKNDMFVDSGILHAMSTAYRVKRDHYPNLHVNIIKWDYSELGKLYKDWGNDWIYKIIGNHSRITKSTMHYTKTVFNHTQQTFRNDSNRCDITGHEKCKLYMYDNKWYTFFMDVDLSNYVGSNHVTFYFDKKIYVKQVYNAIRWFESLPEFNPELVHDIQGRDASTDGPFVKYYESWNCAIGRYPLDPLDVYSRAGLQKFMYTSDETSPDSINVLTYFKNHDKRVYDIYMNGLSELKSLFNYKTYGYNPTIQSKSYFIKSGSLRQIIHPQIGTQPKVGSTPTIAA